MDISKKTDKLRNDIRKARRKILFDTINFWLDNQEHTDGYRTYMIEIAVSEYMEFVEEIGDMDIETLDSVREDLG